MTLESVRALVDHLNDPAGRTICQPVARAASGTACEDGRLNSTIVLRLDVRCLSNRRIQASQVGTRKFTGAANYCVLRVSPE